MKYNSHKRRFMQSGRFEGYKVFISVLFGLLGFIGAFYPVEINYGGIGLNIIWSLIFPIIITLAWGKRYGCISIFAGLTIFYPFYSGRYHGWEDLTCSFALFIWIMIQGYGSEKWLQIRKFYFNVYFLQFIQGMIHIVMYFTIFPFLYRFNQPFWYLDAHTTISYSTIAVLAVKSFIAEFIIFAISDVLLLLPIIRKIFRLPSSKASRYNTRIVLIAIAVGLFSPLVILIFNYFIMDQQHSFRWLLHPSARASTTLLLAGILCAIIGGTIARFFQRQLQTEEGLRVSEAKYRSLFENINDVFVEASLDGTILSISPSVKKILGFTSEDLVGTNVNDLYNDTEQRKQMIDAILQEKELNNYEASMKDKDGQNHYMWLNKKVVDYGNDDRRTIGVARDVTQYKEARAEQEESAKNYKLLFDKMLNGLLVLEPIYDDKNEMTDVLIVDANPGFEKLTGLNTVDIIGETWSEVFKYQNSHLRDYKRVLQTGEGFQYENYNLLFKQYFRMGIFKINDNRLGAIFENVTERKIAEEELRKVNAELEQRVNERTAELQSVVHELEAFTYTVSHDLKSPLRVIDGYNKIILEDYEKVMDEDFAKMVGNVRNICREMIEMINKLLQYSTTSKLTINKESVNLDEIFRRIFRDLQSADPERKLELVIENQLPEVMADEVLIKQVIFNILTNAIKFTRAREKALVTVGCQTSDKERIFYVKDNGVGFDMEYSGKLFGVFQRLHSAREYEGSGIGLATVRKIIQKHDGRSWIEGKVDEGAEVHFTLPVY